MLYITVFSRRITCKTTLERGTYEFLSIAFSVFVQTYCVIILLYIIYILHNLSHIYVTFIYVDVKLTSRLILITVGLASQ